MGEFASNFLKKPVYWLSGEVSTIGRFKKLIVTIKENKTGKNRSDKLILSVHGLPEKIVEVVQEGK